MKKPTTLRHGFGTRVNRHPFYIVWKNMRQRCLDKNSKSFKDYGGRGIALCERWELFENFRDDMFSTWEKGLTIERKDNDGIYCPSNCYWATRVEQNRNKRSNHFLTVNGRTAPVSVWASEIHPENLDLIYVRLRRGWTPEQAVTIPVGKQRPQFHGRWAV